MVIETPDAVMVAHKDRAQDVKQLVDTLKKDDRTETDAGTDGAAGATTAGGCAGATAIGAGWTARAAVKAAGFHTASLKST